MYFWKTDLLAKEIKENTLSEEQKKNYYLATAILSIIFMYMAIAGGSEDALAVLAECILVVVVTLFAINITFKTNGGNEGSDYISRMLILGFPVLIKVFLVSILIGIVLGVAAAALDLLELAESPWGTVVIAASVQLFYYWRINVHLRAINE